MVDLVIVIYMKHPKVFKLYLITENPHTTLHGLVAREPGVCPADQHQWFEAN